MTQTLPALRPSSAQFNHPDTKQPVRFRASAVKAVEAATAAGEAQSVFKIAKDAGVSELTVRKMLYIVPSLRALVAAGHVGRSENGVTPKLGRLHPNGDLPFYKSAGTELTVVIDHQFGESVIEDDLRERIAVFEHTLSRTSWSPKKRQKALEEFIAMEMHAASREDERAAEVTSLEDKVSRSERTVERYEAILEKLLPTQAIDKKAVAVHRRVRPDGDQPSA